jgi:hypothetical protein
MGIDHRGFDILVAEEFLDGMDVVAVLEQVGGEGVAKGVATDTFVDFGAAHGGFQRFLDAAGVEVVPPDDRIC